MDNKIIKDLNYITPSSENPLYSWDSSGYISGAVISASPCNFFGLSGYNSKTSAQYLLLFDTTSVPADGLVPRVVIKIEASQNFYIDANYNWGKYFQKGLYICNSSTIVTKTIGSADITLNVDYKL